MAAAKNPRVFFDITIDGIEQDRMEMDLYKDEVPLTAENFRALCTNDEGNPPSSLSFKGSIFHYILRGVICQGGDLRKITGGDLRKITGGAGFGGSIYGDKFPDVEVSTRRNRAFDLITAHAVPKIPRNHTGSYPYDTACGSRFYICFQPAPLFDERHVVFGTVMAGRNTVLNMSSAGSPCGVPTKEVKIVDCGQIW